MEQQEDLQLKKMLTKDLIFQEYPSIELSTRDKIIANIRTHGYDKQNIEWVATQKIHGSNFSIHCSGDKVRYGRRTDFLTDDIQVNCENPGKFFKQSFFNAQVWANKHHNNVVHVFNNLKTIYPEMLKMAIYGEYFGGNYPNVTNKDCKPVQRGVYYIPHHQFIAFDICVFSDKEILWVDVSDIEKILKDKFQSMPIYAKGTFDEMLNIDSKIDSTIPELFGFPKLQKNTIEGFVIRPNHNLKFEDNERVIIKRKNMQFSEVAKAPTVPKQKQNKSKPLDPEVVPYIQTLEKYLNFNRIESVVSKFPDVKDRNKLKMQITKDIISDAAKDEYKEPQGELAKKVKNQFDKRVMKMVNDYFVKH